MIITTEVKLIGSLILVIALAGWWALHNRSEQKQGAQDCLQATTETKTEVRADNATTVGDQAVQLTRVVAIYDAKVRDLAASNADLARRLRANQVRQSTAANPQPAASGAGCPVPVPGGQEETRRAAVAAAEAKVFDDCDANFAGRLAVIQAYNDWRDRMIAAQK